MARKKKGDAASGIEELVDSTARGAKKSQTANLEPVLPPPPGNPVKISASASKESTGVEVKEDDKIELPDIDLIERAAEMLSSRINKSRSCAFEDSIFTYHELEFLLKIVNLSKARTVQVGKVLTVYSERDSKARQKVVELAELLNLKLRIT